MRRGSAAQRSARAEVGEFTAAAAGAATEGPARTMDPNAAASTASALKPGSNSHSILAGRAEELGIAELSGDVSLVCKIVAVRCDIPIMREL